MKKENLLNGSLLAIWVLGLIFFQSAGVQAAPGDLDLTFGNGGTVVTETGYNEGAKAVAVAPDGKILVAADKRIARYSSEGVLEQTFGSMHETYTDIAVQPDGKIITVGNYYSRTGCGAYRVYIRRFNADGSVDPSFGVNGGAGSGYTVYANGCGTSGYRAYGNSIFLQDNGKIVVGGSIALGEHYDFLALRLNADGSFDDDFNGEGVGIYPVGNSDDKALDVAVQKITGRIILAGYSASPQYPPSEYAALVMLESNGYYAINFGSSGKVTTDLGGSSENRFFSVAFQSKARIVTGGLAYTWGVSVFRVAALYQTNGSLDTNFSGDGIYSSQTATVSPFKSVAVQPDGKILAASENGAVAGFFLYRFNLNGSLDTTFSGDGVQVVDIPGGFEAFSSMAVQPDGKIILAGSVTADSDRDIALARFLP